MNIPELQQKFNGQYKLTRQREIIFHTLTDHAGRHLSAEDIYNTVRQQYPEIGLATIYRAMELFNNLGIVQKLDFGDGCHRYELCDHHSRQHHHMICIVCGKVIEMAGYLPDKFEPDISHMNDFSILDYQLYFYGYCKECQSKYRK
ncbi:Fur family ferric uptake transcriptional regulator [Sporomusaceae bacterium BoRhaA]|uniref:Fur family transcriptional regulator n=1 Tax=Pelorhabdus rhamnosifermentans TaxID=2772457 RepID=UPI001FE8C6A3|nr:Fur family transcriptional regulator [Pelorhabdus rhamnosifermentans]MBU2703511.1 Fur family ferric uptake transcriptional regulator [Pelorhabdus rhamnosifermentans]